MIYKFNSIKSHDRTPPLDVTFTWNSDTGVFQGPDADYVEDLVDRMLQQGYVNVAPCMNIRFSDDHVTPEMLGTILANYWDIADILPSITYDYSIPEVPDIVS